ncbi:SPOR domain-containing protein [Noviherbaspirillum pedocola]|uniref:SPOR domain-containing protein n=1 Tax=Noviherbaspirillum pedocola TaxID=2801341 RepID=A0A934SZQ4_9BURK|nr:SPOR domain-containing protein [Noviherbaspirillum pedocola]MBK4738275.1 SPOR domain-containing protein [Noviherbaspirillum pedocola]
MNHYRNSQAGGTVVGLIIGLIIGLGIAVGVALTIKNTPLPFTNKIGKGDRADKTATAPPAVPPAPSAPAAQAPGALPDPNRALYGNRDAARQAAKDVPRKSEEQKAADDELEAKIQEAQREAAARDAAKAKAAAAAKPPVIDKSLTDKGDAPDEKFTYYLQAGAFLDQSDAENAKAKLALMGLSATVSERKTDNGVLYRVRVGPYGKVETVNRVRSRLSDNGVDVAVVRVPK